MKNLLKVFGLYLILSIPFKSLSQSDCNPYFLLKEGRKWTSANYNAKDKYQGKQSYEVLSLSEEGGALTANVKVISYDKKDETVFDKEIEFVCKEGVIEMDMSKYIPEETMEKL